jgi:ABC-type antimicrobial peptide transport system permease subunit
LGLLLVNVGLGGMTARAVAGRTRELGVRLALGARPSRLWWITMWDALVPVGVGVTVGGVVAVGGLRLLRTILVGVPSLTPALWVAASVLVAACCASAAAIPARRVFNVQPSTALRAE